MKAHVLFQVVAQSIHASKMIRQVCRQDLEETGLSGEEADQVAWDAPDDSPRDDNRRDDTTKAPGK